MSKDLSKKNVDRLIETGLIIADEEPSGAAIGYMHAVLSQVGLPRSKIEERRFERVSGGAHLLIHAGELWNGRQFVEQPIPYGPKPRVMMADLFSYALKHKTRTIDPWGLCDGLLAPVGFDFSRWGAGAFDIVSSPGSGAICVSDDVGHQLRGKGHHNQRAADPAVRGLDGRPGRTAHLVARVAGVVRRVLRVLREFAVPLDMRAVHSLSGSALALDLYTALAHRLHRLRKPLLLRWASWKEQFGQEYSDPRDFRRELRRQVKAVLAVYPAARVEQVTGGLMLYPSPPPVPKLRVIRGGA